MNYGAGKGPVGHIIEFFSFYSLTTIHNNELQSIEDCLKYLEKRDIPIQLPRLLSILKKFEHEGFILKMGQKGSDQIYGSTYLAQTINTNQLDYGSYDMYYWGFRSVRTHFFAIGFAN